MGSAGQPAYAGFWRRLAATLVDLVLVVSIAALVATATGEPAFRGTLDTQGSDREFSLTASGWTNWVLFLYYVVLGAILRRTPGKWTLGLEIVRADDGGPCSTLRHIGRTLGYVLDVMTFFIGYLWIAVDGRKQALHDKVSGTVVVRQ